MSEHPTLFFKEADDMEWFQLPIDFVSDTEPPVFRWKQVVDTPLGKSLVQHESVLPITLERAVQRLVTIAKSALRDCASLRGEVEALRREKESVVCRAGQEGPVVKPTTSAKHGRGGK